jgi:hypothetical protein
MYDSQDPALQNHAKIDPGGASIHEANGKNMNFSNNLCACKLEIKGARVGANLLIAGGGIPGVARKKNKGRDYGGERGTKHRLIALCRTNFTGVL